MSQYYNPRRSKNLYQKNNKEPFKLSRSKVDLFLNCKQCFYLDRKLGVGTPPGFPFAINSAVDALLKKEFDGYRQQGAKHPLIEKYEIDAVPVNHPQLDVWRENFKGVQYHHVLTNFILTGAIDDLWINSKDEYIVVDYKATSKEEDITVLDKDWHDSYKRQMEFYQWLLRKNNLKVSDIGYFLYCNGKTDKDNFNGVIKFDMTIIPYQGSDSWVEETLKKIKDVLEKDTIPESDPNCDFCLYRKEAEKVIKENSQGNLFA